MGGADGRRLLEEDFGKSGAGGWRSEGGVKEELEEEGGVLEDRRSEGREAFTPLKHTHTHTLPHVPQHKMGTEKT